jgi:hypothetical protein
LGDLNIYIKGSESIKTGSAGGFYKLLTQVGIQRAMNLLVPQSFGLP